MSWTGSGGGDIFVAQADLDGFCRERLAGEGTPVEQLTSWLRVYDLLPTWDGEGNLLHLELTTFSDTHHHDSPAVVLDALTPVARPGSSARRRVCARGAARSQAGNSATAGTRSIWWPPPTP